MPSVSLGVPAFEQEYPYSCVPACVRMVLAFHGRVHAEADLRHLLDTDSSGTVPINLMRVTGLGVDVQLGSGSLPDLWTLLGAGLPPIVFLDTLCLPYWRKVCAHAAAVVGLDDTEVSLNDPAFASAPQKVGHDDFLKAWAANDHLCAVIAELPAGP